MSIRVERFTADRRHDFGAVHSDEAGGGWCQCVAWWVPTWNGWGDRTAAENAALRSDLCARGEYDGLLAYRDDDPVGWCQLGPRDRLAKLVTHLELEPDPTVWAVTCFVVRPSERHRGVARALLEVATEVARADGAKRLEGYPRVGGELEDGEAWTGVESLFAAAGFRRLRDGQPRSVWSLDL